MTAIVDYGVGNLFSLKSSFAALGEEAVITGNRDDLLQADRVILPGVGAFGDAAEKLRATGMDRAVKDVAEAGKPLMGICLGMQLLFDRGLEFGNHAGLGLIPGEVRSMTEIVPAGMKLPQIGWNSLQFTENSTGLFRHIHEGDFVYFVHSFHGTGCEKYTIAVTDYGARITAAVQRDNVCGCQFHPEKSGKVGLAILKAFCEGGF